MLFNVASEELAESTDTSCFFQESETSETEHQAQSAFKNKILIENIRLLHTSALVYKHRQEKVATLSRKKLPENFGL